MIESPGGTEIAAPHRTVGKEKITTQVSHILITHPLTQCSCTISQILLSFPHCFIIHIPLRNYNSHIYKIKYNAL